METDDERNARLESEFRARPDAPAKTAQFNLEHGDVPIAPGFDRNIHSSPVTSSPQATASQPAGDEPSWRDAGHKDFHLLYHGNEADPKRLALVAKKNDWFINKYGRAEIDTVEPPTPETKLDPQLEALRQKYESRDSGQSTEQAGNPEQPETESTETTDTTEGTYDPAWETSNDQALIALEQEHGAVAKTIVDNDLRTLFAGYIEKYPNDVRFIQELTMRVGNHPGIFRLLNHLATRLRYSRT